MPAGRSPGSAAARSKFACSTCKNARRPTWRFAPPIIGVLKTLVAEQWTSLAEQQRWAVEPLAEIFLAVARDAEAARIENVEYLRALGLQTSRGCTAGELWRHLLAVSRDRLGPAAAPWLEAWNVLADEGPLARRILRRLENSASQPAARIAL